MQLRSTSICSLLLCALVNLQSQPVGAATYYVDAQRTDDTGSGTAWSSAKKTLQAAMPLVRNGDTVMVNDGVYDRGGAAVIGADRTNRVVISSVITLRSLNGPERTTIRGSGTNVTEAAGIRCVYLTDGAILDGFTISDGYALGGSSDDGNGAGVYASGENALITNCIVLSNVAHGRGGGIYGGTVRNCQLRGNRVEYFNGDGGGASGITMYDCTIADNWSNGNGGGVDNSTLYRCELTGNWSDDSGGGAYDCDLYDCTLSHNVTLGRGGGAGYSLLLNCSIISNRAEYGGGVYARNHEQASCSSFVGNTARQGGAAYGGLLSQCILKANLADDATEQASGGASYDSELHSCLLIRNEAKTTGGGAYEGGLNNCTLVENRAYVGGGGAGRAELRNCIVYGNYGGDVFECVLENCYGIDVGEDPLFADESADDYSLRIDSPCIDAGDNSHTDLDYQHDLAGRGRLANDTVDIGGYEYPLPPIPSTNWFERFYPGTSNRLVLAASDSDGDGSFAWEEYIAGTDPTRSESHLRAGAIAAQKTGTAISWEGTSEEFPPRFYSLHWTDDPQKGFSLCIASNIPSAWPILNVYTDRIPHEAGIGFYQIGVQISE